VFCGASKPLSYLQLYVRFVSGEHKIQADPLQSSQKSLYILLSPVLSGIRDRGIISYKCILKCVFKYFLMSVHRDFAS
jgi:hypothetical protein